MSFHKKYLKYKKKYLDLKNQKGGYTLNLSEWVKIENSGQQNCGIFISNIYPNYILKCGTDVSKINEVIEINKIVQLFPTIINSTNIDKDNYTTMEKLDGDITKIFFNLFPKIVLTQMINEKIINTEQKENLLTIFEGKISYTMNNSKSLYLYLDRFVFDYLRDPEIFNINAEYLNSNPEKLEQQIKINIKGINYEIFNRKIDITKKEYDNKIQILEKIRSITNISFELYDNFMKRLLDMWNSYYEIIIKEIIKIKLILYNLGYSYEDPKFDNYGYKLSVTPINRNFNVPRIFNQYLYVYFIDSDSGLTKISGPNPKIYENKIIDDVNDGFKYTAHGQYCISEVNRSILNYEISWNLDMLKDPMFIESKYEWSTNKMAKYNPDLKLLGINDNMKKILESKYNFDINKYKHSFTNIEEVNEFVSS